MLQGCHRPEVSVLGAMQVSLDATLLENQTRQQTIFHGILSGVTFLLIGGVLAFALRKTVLNPLSSLAQSAQELSQGNYEARAKSEVNDEIGMLAKTFNGMAESIEQRTQELEASRQEVARWNIDLEDKIQRRTKELSTLNAIITTLSQSLNLDQTLDDTLTKILAVTEGEAGMVQLRDEKTGQLVTMVHRGLAPGSVQGIAGQVVQSGEVIIRNDIADKKESI